MDSLITAAARALEASDPLGALNRVALRDDAPALALRGIAMVQHGRFPERDPMSARSGFGSRVTQSRLPLFPQQQTFLSPAVTSEKCHKRSLAFSHSGQIDSVSLELSLERAEGPSKEGRTASSYCRKGLPDEAPAPPSRNTVDALPGHRRPRVQLRAGE